MEDFILWGLNGYAWTTIVVITGIFAAMLFSRISTDFIFLGGIAILMFTGVLDEKDAVAGFSDLSIVTIAVLFIVVAAITRTGLVQFIAKKVLGIPKNHPQAIVRLMAPVALLSSFLSNVTVVAMFLNVVRIWSKKLNIAPSKLLIPLSYAAGFGGCLTLIGTPPNLIISGMYANDTGQAMNFFTPTLPALVTLLVGMLSVVLMRRLLPRRKSSDEAFAATHEYTVEMIVPADNPHIGQTIEEAQLTQVRGGHLIEIVRFDGVEVKSPVPADEYLLGSDRLIFTGHIDELMDLRRSHGLTVATEPVFKLDDVEKKRILRPTIVTQNSRLRGQRLRDVSFEADNGYVAVAIARQGERIDQSPRDVVLKAGDTLLFECSRNATPVTDPGVGRDVKYFESDDVPETGFKTVLSCLILVGMILLSSLKIVSLFESACIAAAAMLLTRCCSIEAARRSVNWNVLMIFSGSVCLGAAIQRTGLAVTLSEALMNLSGSNPIVVLTVVCFIGTFVTEFVSNTATAAILYPIAYQSAISLGVNPVTFCVALMLSASSSFATPIGSPTHLLVYGPGGYRFSDFLKIGLPMNFIILAVNIAACLLFFPL